VEIESQRDQATCSAFSSHTVMDQSSHLAPKQLY
jgi:hypothetical protein